MLLQTPHCVLWKKMFLFPLCGDRETASKRPRRAVVVRFFVSASPWLQAGKCFVRSVYSVFARVFVAQWREIVLSARLETVLLRRKNRRTMLKYPVIIFDLDGTLLDTLHDLHAAVNHALAAHNLPLRTLQEVRAALGNGVGALLQQSVPPEADAATLEAVTATFRPYYLAHSLDATRPYEGIAEALAALKRAGHRMGIVSNKPDDAVQELHRRFFAPAGVDIAVGERRGVPRKPDPAAVFSAMARLGAEPGQAVYVGDSEVDLETARRAGLPCIACAWGFRDEPQLVEAGAGTIIYRPAELPELLNL